MFEFSHGPPAFKTRWCISKIQEPIQRNQGGDYVRLAAPLKKAVLIFSAKPGASGFPENETFREKMRKFSVAFRIFSRKQSKMRKFRENANIS